MHTDGTKFIRQRWWGGADWHQSRRCEFDGQRTTFLPIMPPASDLGTGLLILRKISISCTNQWTHMEQSLADRGDGEDLIDTKVLGVHTTDNKLQPSQYASSVWFGLLSITSVCKTFFYECVSICSWVRILPRNQQACVSETGGIIGRAVVGCRSNAHTQVWCPSAPLYHPCLINFVPWVCIDPFLI